MVSYLITAVRQPSLPDVRGLVLRNDLHDPGPNHGAIPGRMPAPRVQGALQGRLCTKNGVP